MNMTLDKWTVVATRGTVGETYPVHCWLWEPDVSVTGLRAAAEEDRVILMHRRTGRRVELVARLAGPNWRAFQRRRSMR